jgi:predicted PurR-regulated permease PerM
MKRPATSSDTDLPPPGKPISSTFTRRLLGVGLFVVALVAFWQLRHLMLLMFAAILVSLVLRSTASGLRRVFPFLGELSAFYIATILGVGLLAGSGYMLGAQLRGELQDIWDQLSELFVPLEDWLGLEDIEQWLVERGEELFSEISVLYWIVGVSSAMAGVIANAVLILAAAFYFGLQPQIYRGGLVMLLPPSLRPSAEGALDAISYGLRRWIMGQLVAMLLVGILTYVGLSLLGVPSALALAVIAGLLEFIPFIGPILAAVPALAIALAQSPQLALWVLALYVLIQQVESNLLTPLIQQRAVRLPPVATLFAVIAAGLLFGFLGILLATPLAVACMIGVKKLWVRDALGEDVKLPDGRGRR